MAPLVPPSPKVQLHVAMLPWLWSVKLTSALSAVVLYVLALKAAVGGSQALMTPLVALLLVLRGPRAGVAAPAYVLGWAVGVFSTRDAMKVIAQVGLRTPIGAVTRAPVPVLQASDPATSAIRELLA